jgi:dTDP-glucose 4,6-dehydratase
MFETKSNKKTAVVTGGAGFLGSHLSDRLLAEGFRVIAIDNLITGNTDNIEHLAGNPDFKFIRHNVSEYIFVPGPVDYVFHFASPASPIDYLEHPIPTLKVGALGSHNTLGLAILWFTPKAKTTGGMSIRSDHAAYTTRLSASRKR